MKSNIELQPVDSSKIAGIGYNPETETLAIQFKNREGVSAPYEYKGFTADSWEAFKQAESKGRHFNLFILNRYPFVKCD